MATTAARGLARSSMATASTSMVPSGMLHCLGTADGKRALEGGHAGDLRRRPELLRRQRRAGRRRRPADRAVGGSPAGPEPDDFRDLKGNGTGIVAFDKFTGKERYRTTDELASYSSPIVTRNQRPTARALLVPQSACRLRCRRRETAHFSFRGGRNSSKASTPPTRSSSAIDILLTECYGVGSVLLKVDGRRPRSSGRTIPIRAARRSNATGTRRSTSNGFVYGSSGRNSETAELRCIDLATGDVKWRQPDLGRCSLLLVDGHFVVWTEFGQLLLVKLDPTRYVEVARMDFGIDRPRSVPRPLLGRPGARPTVGCTFAARVDCLCLELIPPP